MRSSIYNVVSSGVPGAMGAEKRVSTKHLTSPSYLFSYI
jgi:hypothetical protein